MTTQNKTHRLTMTIIQLRNNKLSQLERWLFADDTETFSEFNLNNKRYKNINKVIEENVEDFLLYKEEVAFNQKCKNFWEVVQTKPANKQNSVFNKITTTNLFCHDLMNNDATPPFALHDARVHGQWVESKLRLALNLHIKRIMAQNIIVTNNIMSMFDQNIELPYLQIFKDVAKEPHAFMVKQVQLDYSDKCPIDMDNINQLMRQLFDKNDKVSIIVEISSLINNGSVVLDENELSCKKYISNTVKAQKALQQIDYVAFSKTLLANPAYGSLGSNYNTLVERGIYQYNGPKEHKKENEKLRKKMQNTIKDMSPAELKALSEVLASAKRN